MKSHEVLKRVVETVGAKRVAHDLGVSTSLVYKWCAEPPADLGEDGSGARNPLDRLVSLVDSTGDRSPIEWLCSEVGGYFVEAPVPDEETADAEYIRQIQALIAEFSSLLQVMSESIVDDGRIDAREADTIRGHLQRLHGRSEAFVRACEQGVFDPGADAE